MLKEPLKPTEHVPPDYKTQAGVLLSSQPLRQSTEGGPACRATETNRKLARLWRL
jgi:hypothetical protein